MVCKKQNTKKYSKRDSPPYSAQDCKGKQKKGNDGKLYQSEPDKRGIYRWKPISNKTRKNTNSQINTHVKVKGEKSYLIHSNGGRPYIVYVSPNKIVIYSRIYNKNIGDYDGTKKIIDIKYKKVFIGDNNDNLRHYDALKGEFPGNTILIHTKNNNYIYIGDEIYSFSLPEDEIITHYYSPVGNNDVPYPFAISNKYTYFMLDSKKLPNELFTLEDKNNIFYKDRYSQFYGFHLKDEKHKKEWEKIKEKNSKSFKTKIIHTP
jgi:hypothetical protein